MRERILERVREALAGRERAEHPGPFPGPGGELPHDPVELFQSRFTEAGGEVVRLPSAADAREWLSGFCSGLHGVAVGVEVPAALTPDLPRMPPDDADLGVSVALGAAGFTGSLLLDARGGRRPQLLPPTHLVWLREETVHRELRELLDGAGPGASSALALHSGPSKSADIGQHLVTGVHGPGRVVAAILARAPDASEP